MEITLDSWWDPGKCPSPVRLTSLLLGIAVACLKWLGEQDGALGMVLTVQVFIWDGAHTSFYFLFSNNDKCYVLLKIFHFLQNKPSYDSCPSICTAKFMFDHIVNNYKCCFHWDVFRTCWVAGRLHYPAAPLPSLYIYAQCPETIWGYRKCEWVNDGAGCVLEMGRLGVRTQAKKMASLFRSVTATESSLSLLYGCTFWSRDFSVFA